MAFGFERPIYFVKLRDVICLVAGSKKGESIVCNITFVARRRASDLNTRGANPFLQWSAKRQSELPQYWTQATPDSASTTLTSMRLSS